MFLVQIHTVARMVLSSATRNILRSTEMITMTVVVVVGGGVVVVVVFSGSRLLGWVDASSEVSAT
jgi:type III secretory pathway component EscU